MAEVSSCLCVPGERELCVCVCVCIKHLLARITLTLEKSKALNECPDIMQGDFLCMWCAWGLPAGHTVRSVSAAGRWLSSSSDSGHHGPLFVSVSTLGFSVLWFRQVENWNYYLVLKLSCFTHVLYHCLHYWQWGGAMVVYTTKNNKKENLVPTQEATSQ